MGAAPSLMCTTVAAKSKRLTGVTASCIAPHPNIPNGQPLGYTARGTVLSMMGAPTRPLRPTIPPAPTRRGAKVRRLIGATWGGSVTPPEPEPEPRDRGNWREGTEYVAGDIVTAYSQKNSAFKKYRAKKDHTSTSENFAGRDMHPGTWDEYWQRL